MKGASLRLSLAACFLCLFEPALADFRALRESFQVHGFLSQGYILTSNNDLFGNSRTGGSLDFRELGINASVRPLPKLQLSAQLLSRRAGGTDEGEVRIDYGFADYAFMSTVNLVAGVRAGRLTNPLGFYNETRDVAFTRNGILLPQSIYFDRTRNLALSADGGSLYGEWRSPFGDFFLTANIVLPRVGETEERALLGRDFAGELESDLSIVGRILYEGGGGKLRLAVSGTQTNVDYESGGLGDPLNSGPATFEPIIFSAQYNTERFSLTGEYAQRSFALEGIFPRDIDVTGESFYVQASYQLGDRWEAMVRFDSLVSDRNDRDGESFAAANPGRPAFTRFAKDWTVGLRWDITRQFMLRAEYHHVDGTAWLPLEDNPNLGSLAPHWDIFALLASFRF